MKSTLRISLGILLLALAMPMLSAKELRILAIGNSFSRDAIEQNLHELAEADGHTAIIGNLFIGGCSLDFHLYNAKGDRHAYVYRKIGADGLMQERDSVDANRRAAEASGIKVVVPSGTAVQNARTSFVGDRLNCDGYHLDLTLGRYTAACTWYERLFGEDVRANTYAPALARVARESAHAAVATPGRVTDMSHLQPGE